MSGAGPDAPAGGIEAEPLDQATGGDESPARDTISLVRDTDRPGCRDPVLVGAAAAAIRLIWVLAMSRVPVGLTDLTLYPDAAESIAGGHGYRSILGTPTAYYPPGYPYFLGAIRWVVGGLGLADHFILSAGIVQALLGFFTAGAVVVAGRRLGGRRAGIVAGLLIAVWPNLVIHASLMLSESLFLAVFAVLLAAVFTMVDSDRIVVSRAVVAAAAMGMCALIRPQSVLLLIPALALVWAVSRIGWRALVIRTAILCAGVFVFVAPWTVRNLIVMDGLVAVSTNTGDNLCVGFHPGATGGFAIPPYCNTGEFYTDGPEAELRRDAETRARAIRFAKDHPGALPLLSLRKVQIAYGGDHDAVRALESFGQDPFLSDTTRTILRVASDVYFFVVVAAAAIGSVLLAGRAWRKRRADQTGLLLLAATVSAFIVPVISFADERFKVPVAPCFALLAAVAVVSVLGARSAPAPTRAEEGGTV